MREDDNLTIQCGQNCSKDKNRLFGYINYPDFNPVCLSAFHSGVINEKGGKFTLKLN